MRDVEPPIFVVGCSHSGTSLMLAIIGAHSKVYAIRDETRMFNTRRLNVRALHQFNKETLEAGKNRWVEKTADHIFQIERIFKSFPRSKVIAMLRDGRDVAASIYAREGNFLNAMNKWVRTCKILRKWKDSKKVLIVKYEDLVSDFENVMTEVFEFLGLEYEEGVRDFYRRFPKAEKPPNESDEHHLQLRAWQLSQPVYNGSGRWKTQIGEHGKWIIKEVAEEMLIEMGYE